MYVSVYIYACMECCTSVKLGGIFYVIFSWILLTNSASQKYNGECYLCHGYYITYTLCDL